MNIFRKLLVLFGWDRIVTGTVISKKHWVAPQSSVPRPEMVGGQEVILQTPLPPVESWQIMVRGLDRAGNTVDENIWISEEDWNSIKEGDPWPAK